MAAALKQAFDTAAAAGRDHTATTSGVATTQGAASAD